MPCVVLLSIFLLESRSVIRPGGVRYCSASLFFCAFCFLSSVGQPSVREGRGFNNSKSVLQHKLAERYPKYTGGIVSVNTLPKSWVSFGTASIPYQTLRLGSVRPQYRHIIPDTWIRRYAHQECHRYRYTPRKTF